MANRSKSKQIRFFLHTYNQFSAGITIVYKKVARLIKAKPLTIFFITLLSLLVLLVAGNFLSGQKKEPEKREIVKIIQTYQVEENPKVTLQAKIEKSGVIKISALTPGVVRSINFSEGNQIPKGAVLINISTNYQGGNSASIQRQIAQKQYQNTKDTFDTQKDLLNIQKNLAEKTESNSSQLRDIQNQSIQETQGLIDLNQSILDALVQNQTNLENNNDGGVNDTAISQIKLQRAGVQGSLNQLRAGLRQTQFQAAGDKPPAELASLQKDTTLKQLSIQQKTLELGLEISRLQLIAAQIYESLFFPASPFAAIVQKVYVKEGQTVNPGTPLMTISATDDPITAMINLPQNLASAISSTEPSMLYINDQILKLKPHFISTEATDSTLYSVIYLIPDQFSKELTEGGNITVEIPIGLPTNKAIPFIPLDSAFQNTTSSTVLVVQDDKAVSKVVVLGNVFGRFVEVKSGLSLNDQIILNRNVLAGDKVSIQND